MIEKFYKKIKREPIDLAPLFQVYFTTEKGRRTRNEDNFLIIRPVKEQVVAEWLVSEQLHSVSLPDWPFQHARLAVADGMGGHRFGKEIAQTAMEELLSLPPINTRKQMVDSIHTLHKELYQKYSTTSEDSPGTTLIIADLNLKTGQGILANIGDSRAYKLSIMGVEQLTLDHTYDEFNWRDGTITQKQYQESLSRTTNDIVQALGHGSFGIIRQGEDGYRPNRYSSKIRIDLSENLPIEKAGNADITEIAFKKGESVLMATDGLWSPNLKGKWQGPITNHPLSTYEIKAQVNRALREGTRDNVTAVIFGFQDY